MIEKVAFVIRLTLLASLVAAAAQATQVAAVAAGARWADSQSRSVGMRQTFDANYHDALVLVLPDFDGDCASEAYVTGVLEAINAAFAASHPVFFSSDPCYRSIPSILEALEEGPALDLPEYGGLEMHGQLRFRRKRVQREVDEVAHIVEKPPSETRLGFGGMFGEAAVPGG